MDAIPYRPMYSSRQQRAIGYLLIGEMSNNEIAEVSGLDASEVSRLKARLIEEQALQSTSSYQVQLDTLREAVADILARLAALEGANADPVMRLDPDLSANARLMRRLAARAKVALSGKKKEGAK